MHNNNTINKHSKPTKPFCDKLSNMPKTCNCRKINKDKCPLKGNCLIKSVIYKVKVESKGPDKSASICNIYLQIFVTFYVLIIKNKMF